MKPASNLTVTTARTTTAYATQGGSTKVPLSNQTSPTVSPTNNQSKQSSTPSSVLPLGLTTVKPASNLAMTTARTTTAYATQGGSTKVPLLNQTSPTVSPTNNQSKQSSTPSSVLPSGTDNSEACFEPGYDNCSNHNGKRNSRWIYQSSTLEPDLTNCFANEQSVEAIIHSIFSSTSGTDNSEACFEPDDDNCSNHNGKRNSRWIYQSSTLEPDLTNCFANQQSVEAIIHSIFSSTSGTDNSEACFEPDHDNCSNHNGKRNSRWIYQSSKLEPDLTNCFANQQSVEAIIHSIFSSTSGTDNSEACFEPAMTTARTTTAMQLKVDLPKFHS